MSTSRGRATAGGWRPADRWSSCCTAGSGALPTTAGISRRSPPSWPGRELPVALAEYRRVGAGGGAPRTFEDVTAAIGAAHAALAKDAADPGVVVAGHSAGGHLALLAAARPGTPVTRVLAVAPVADLARAHELGLSDGAVAELLGDAPAFRNASPRPTRCAIRRRASR